MTPGQRVLLVLKAEQLILASARVTIAALELSIATSGHMSQTTINIAHRLRDIVGPDKHGDRGS